MGGESGGLELGEFGGECGELVVSVEAAGVGQYPEARAGDRVGLGADCGLGAVETGAVGGDSDDGDVVGRVCGGEGGEAGGAGAEFGGGEFVGAGGGAGDDVGDAEAVVEQQVLL